MNILQGTSCKVVQALCEKLDCSGKQKGSFCANTRGRSFPFTGWNRSKSAVDLCFTVCLLVCPSVTHTNKQTKFDVLRGQKDRAADSKGRHFDSNCQVGTETSGAEKTAVTPGSKTLPVVDLVDLVRTLAVYCDGRDSSAGRFHTHIQRTCSWIPNPQAPPHLLIPAQARFSRTEEPLNPAGGRENIKHKHPMPELRYCTYCSQFMLKNIWRSLDLFFFFF